MGTLFIGAVILLTVLGVIGIIFEIVFWRTQIKTIAYLGEDLLKTDPNDLKVWFNKVLPKRHPLLPDIPTFKELGYECFDGIQWYGISGPAQIPDKIRSLLNMEINKAIRNPELKDRLSAEAIEPMPMSSDQYTLYIKNDIARWTRVATERKIQLD